jgi:lipopolysaccharide transport system permease protein
VSAQTGSPPGSGPRRALRVSRVETGRTRTGARPTTLISSTRGLSLELSELWKYRELFYFLMWRDVMVRYKQTALGAAWALLQPLLLMLVFAVFLSGRGVSPKGIPYPVFALAALVPWTFFANATAAAANSIVGNPQLISKVYFPRILIPPAAACSFLVDLVMSFVVLLILMAGYGIAPPLRAFLVVPFALYIVLVTVGAGLFLGAVNVRYRDVRYAVPFLMQFWLFASPVAYEFTAVGEKYRWILALNPMVVGIAGFRAALVGHAGLSPGVIALSSAAAAAFVAAGVVYFRRVEDSFADVI